MLNKSGRLRQKLLRSGNNGTITTKFTKVRGFTFQAVEKDVRNPNSDPKCTPAYSIVSLDYNQQNQLFRSKVLEIAKFVEEKLTKYKAERNGRLTMADFRTRILQNPELVQQVFLFVYELFHLKMLAENKQGLTQNTYGSMLMVQSIFTFTLIIDNLIKEKYNNQDSHKQQFMHLLVFLSRKAKLNMDESKPRVINGMFTSDFQGTFEKLMNSQPLGSDMNYAANLKLIPLIVPRSTQVLPSV